MKQRAAFIILTASLAACSNHDDRRGSATVAMSPAGAPAAKALAARADAVARDVAASPSDAARRMIRNASLSVEVKDAEAALRLVDTLVRGRGVVIADSRVTRYENERTTARLLLHVPGPQFDAVLDAVRRIGSVQTESGSSEDVSRAYTDLETRIAVKASTVKRIESLLATRTDKLSDVLEVERELSREIAELEQMKGERRYYDSMVAMASISVDLFEPIVIAPPQLAPPVSAALRRSLELLGTSIVWVVYVVTFAAPWVALAAAIWWSLGRLGVRWPFRPGQRILNS